MAHVRKTVLGLKELLIADTVSTIEDAQWEQLALNLEGTFSFTQDDTETTEINVEENDAPIVQTLKAGKRSFTTSIPDLAFEVVQKLFGATKQSVSVEGETVTRVSLPDDAAYIYKMFKIVPKQGVEQFYYTKGQIAAKINGNLSKTETLNVDLTVTALVPDNDLSAVIYDLKEGTNPGYILGKQLTSTTLNNLKALAGDGEMKFKVDSGATQTVTTLDFSAASDWTDIVSILNASTTGAVWSFDKDAFRMKITSNTLGSSSKVTVEASATPAKDVLLNTFLRIANGDAVIGS